MLPDCSLKVARERERELISGLAWHVNTINANAAARDVNDTGFRWFSARKRRFDEVETAERILGMNSRIDNGKRESRVLGQERGLVTVNAVNSRPRDLDDTRRPRALELGA